MTLIQRYMSILAHSADNSDINHKHGCVAMRKGKIISPPFHNYKRNVMFGHRCGSAHGEMCVVNYLINSLWHEKGLSQCIL